MSRWFRFYDDAVNDPKILRLSDNLFRIWVGLLCLASKNDGALPPTEDICVVLRLKPSQFDLAMQKLVIAGLIDHDGTKLAPHNWNARQYKSDVSTARVKRFRNAHAALPKRPQSTETETEQIPVAKATGAAAPIDHRKRLFNEGLAKLSVLTGKGPDACRSFVGKCLKAASDDAVIVLGLIEEAERNQVVDPSAWIAARLKPVEIRNGTSNNRSGSSLTAEIRRELAELERPQGAEPALSTRPVLLISN